MMKIHRIYYEFYQYNDGSMNNGYFTHHIDFIDVIAFNKMVSIFSDAITSRLDPEDYDNFISDIIPGLCGGRLLSFTAASFDRC